MAYNAFTNAILLDAVEQLKPQQMALTSLFFNKVIKAPVNYADIEVINALSKIAPYLTTTDDASTLVEKASRILRSIKIPYIRVKSRLNPSELQLRTVVDEATEINRVTQMLINIIQRSVERQASEALENGIIVLRNLAGTTIDSIDFAQESSHRFTVTTKWDNASGVPLDDLATICQLCLQDSGVRPDTILMGSSAFSAFINNAQVKAVYNSFNMNLGKLQTPDIAGGSIMGQLAIPGFILNVGAYPETYVNELAVSTPYVPAKKVFVGSTQAKNSLVYGCIQDPEAGMIATDYFPKIYRENDPPCWYIMVQSAPLVMFSQPNAFGCIQVLS